MAGAGSQRATPHPVDRTVTLAISRALPYLACETLPRGFSRRMKDTDAKEGRPGSPARPLFTGLLLGLAFVALLAVGLLVGRQYFGTGGSDARQASGESSASIGGPFTLIDQDGRTVTDSDFRGRWLLVYFGFTYCPDICPTSLARNGDAVTLLGEKGNKVLPVLITVDPERDTPQNLKEYLRSFHPQTVGLTGTPEQIAAVAREYRVYYAKALPSEGDDYLMDHSSFTYLIGPDGRFVQFFRHQASAQEVADFLNERL
jgi:protein SCO1/2